MVNANYPLRLALKTDIPDLLLNSLIFILSPQLSFTLSYETNRKDCRSYEINCVESLTGICETVIFTIPTGQDVGKGFCRN